MTEHPDDASSDIATTSCGHQNDRAVVSTGRDDEKFGTNDWLAEQMILEKWKKKEAQQKQMEWRHRGIMRGSGCHNADCLNPEYLIEAFGSDDPDFVNGLAHQMLTAFSNQYGDSLSFAIAVIKGIEPKDQLEGMLAAQMCAIHIQVMKWSARLGSSEPDDLLIAERMVSKLTRTFASHMETLRKYRLGGERKITVQHVSVNDGGRAIVGNVNHGSGDRAHVLPASPTATLTDARQSAMDMTRENAGVPVSRSTADKDDE